MAFKDLRDVLGKSCLDLPIDGKVYTVGDVDAETGLWAQTLMELGMAAHNGQDIDGAVLDDVQEQAAWERLLGDAFDEMVADGVGWSDIKHAGVTALLWITSDEDTAQAYWESGGNPGEAPARPGPNRASRRASAAAVRKTPTRASTSGTRASKPRRATPGKSSSSSGT